MYSIYALLYAYVSSSVSHSAVNHLNSAEYIHISVCVCHCHFALTAQFTDVKVNDISIRNHAEGPQFICNNYSVKDVFLGHTFRHFSGLIAA